MRRFVILAALALSAALPAAALAEHCSESSSISAFTVEFLGASFDGVDTEFEYCITTETYLDEWKLFLDPDCMDSATITDCGPTTCGWDDTGGVTGILFDDVNLGKGETACFTFSLAGDWTDQIGEVQVRLKHDMGSSKITEICGPTCRICQADIDVSAADGSTTVRLALLHNKPSTVESGLVLSIYNQRGKRVRRWRSEPFTLVYGEALSYETVMPGRALKPGWYKLLIQLQGMSGWNELDASFSVRE